MIKVYRIAVWPGKGGNSYKVKRSEEHRSSVYRSELWVPSLVAKFDTMVEARDFVKFKSRLHTDMVLVAGGPVSEAFVNEFCFENDVYLKYRRYFIETVPFQSLKRALEQDGIQVSFNN